MNYTPDLIESKYHISVAKRMINSYKEFPDKRFVVGIINETAKAVIKMIKTFLILERTSGGIPTFSKKIAPKYLTKLQTEHIIKILKVHQAQKSSPIEFKKQEKIILLIDNKYQILTIERLIEFVNSVENSINKLSAICRQL